jgi:CHC2-type zinc finger protein/AAA domain-containing protein
VSSNGAIDFSSKFLDELRARTPLASLIGRTVKLKRVGKHMKGCCPFHTEKTPSLTVYPDHFKCYGCGKHGDAIAFVRETQHIDFQTAVVQLAAEASLPLPDHVNGFHKPINGRSAAPKPAKDTHKPTNEEAWQPIVPPPDDAPEPTARDLKCDTLYPYHDADGRLLFYVRRFEARNGKGKYFLPLTYGTLDGKLGWHARAPDAPRPLYGLAQLAAFPEATVIICEGEKSADAAAYLFPLCVCVTWPGGAQAVGMADWRPLEGRNTEIIIWPDNDTHGHEAAAKIAARLPRARILRVDDLQEGHDAANVHPDDPDAWLEARLPPEPKAKAEPESEAKARDPLALWHWRERKLEKPENLLGSVITNSSRTFGFGPSGVGKTHLAMGMAAGMASGKGYGPWQASRPCRVLYVDGEMARDLLQERLLDAYRREKDEAAARAMDSNLFALSVEDFPEMQPLNTDDGRDFLLNLIDEIGGLDVVIFDNRMSLTVGDMKEEQPWADTLPLVMELTRRRIAQVWLDHTGVDVTRGYGTKKGMAVRQRHHAQRGGRHIRFRPRLQA